jgi:hypothetical protein
MLTLLVTARVRYLISPNPVAEGVGVGVIAVYVGIGAVVAGRWASRHRDDSVHRRLCTLVGIFWPVYLLGRYFVREIEAVERENRRPPRPPE